jgi:hypothetical protein
MIEINFDDYNLEIPEHMMDPEWAFDIQKRFERAIKKLVPVELADIPQWQYEVQNVINSHKREVIFFHVDEVINDATFKGTVIKEGGFSVRKLGSQHYFHWNSKLRPNEIIGMKEHLYIQETLENLYAMHKSNPENSSFENPLEDMKDDLEISPQQPHPTDNNFDEFMNIMNLVSDLYKMDREYLIRKLIDISGEMKMYNNLKNEPNRTNILKALSFYDQMRSGVEIRSTRKENARRTHADSLTIASEHYELSVEELQKWIGKRNAFRKSKINSK